MKRMKHTKDEDADIEAAVKIAESHEKRIIELDSRKSKQLDETDKSYFTVSLAGLGLQMALFNSATSGATMCPAVMLFAIVDVIIFLAVINLYIKITALNVDYYDLDRDLNMAMYNECVGKTRYPDLRPAEEIQVDIDAHLAILRRYDKYINRFFKAGVCFFAAGILARVIT